MKCWIKVYFIVLALLLLSGCGNKIDRKQLVYSTAYSILTETASAAPNLPASTPTSTGPSPTATLLTTASVESTTVPQSVPLVNTPQAAPTQPAPILTTPTPIRPVSPTLTQPPNQFLSGGQGGFNQFATPTLSPSPTQPAPTNTPVIQPPDQGLVGVWQQEPSGWIFHFKPDGTYRLAPSFGSLQSDLFDEGNYNIQGEQISLTGSANSASCKDLGSIYQFSIPASGQRRLSLIQDQCYDRQTVMANPNWLWLPVNPEATPTAPTAAEIKPVIISLTGLPSSNFSGFNGLTWYNDALILLPQYPVTVVSSQPIIYALLKENINSSLAGITTLPLQPQPVPFNDGGLATRLTGFQGYQAIGVIGDRVYLIAEANPGGGVRNYLVSGSIASGLASITLDANRVIEIPLQANNSGSLYHSLLINADGLYVIPTLNGVIANPAPVGYKYDADLNFLGSQPMIGLEYVVTDATVPDANGRFWVLNRYSPGDPGALTGLDPLAQTYGEGITHQVYEQVERLVPIEITANGIVSTSAAPVQFELSARGPRNWQGISRLNTGEFLMITNQANSPVLAYLEIP